MSIITDYLTELMTKGGDSNFLIINLSNNAYLQFASEKGSKVIYCEAAGSNSNTGLELDKQQIAQLSMLSWTLVSSDFYQNYCQEITIQTLEDLEKLEQLIHRTALLYQATAADFSYQINLA